MKAGDVVTVSLYRGKTAERRVIVEKIHGVVMCCEAEWQAAKAEHREPRGICFPWADVHVKPEDRAVTEVSR